MIGKLLHIYRVTNDLTLRQMERVLGISYATISRIENGERMDTKTLIKLFNWLFQELK